MASGGYKIRNQEGIYFITFAVVEWIDVFTRETYRKIVVESLRFCQEKKGLNIHGWVIMSNHLHLIISAKAGYRLSDILRDFKKYTSVRNLRKIENLRKESRRSWMLRVFRSAGKSNSRNETHQFWRQENHPIELRSPLIKIRCLTYLHNNPVAAGIVDKPEYYLYSSARDYQGIKGVIDIDFL
ncbi:MAG: transposase [Bacteroidetes bacterium]|nr:transposase [Bacteroidota bacterium]